MVFLFKLYQFFINLLSKIRLTPLFFYNLLKIQKQEAIYILKI